MAEVDFVLKPLIAQCQCNTALLRHRITNTQTHILVKRQNATLAHFFMDGFPDITCY